MWGEIVKKYFENEYWNLSTLSMDIIGEPLNRPCWDLYMLVLPRRTLLLHGYRAYNISTNCVRAELIGLLHLLHIKRISRFWVNRYFMNWVFTDLKNRDGVTNKNKYRYYRRWNINCSWLKLIEDLKFNHQNKNKIGV